MNIRTWIHDQDLAKLEKVVWEGNGHLLLKHTSSKPKIRKFIEAVPRLMNDIKNLHAGNALCFRNFQNVKLRLDFVEIWLFYRHSDFTWNQILAKSNGSKISFLAIVEVLNLIKVNLSNFQVPNLPNFNVWTL